MDISLLRNSNLFRGLEDDDIERLLHVFRAGEKSYQKGSYILHAGDSTAKLGILISGKAMIVQEDWWGNRNIISEILPPSSFGEVFACVPSSTLTVSVKAEEDSSVLFLDAESILKMTDTKGHEKVIRNFITDLAMKNMRFSEKLRHVGGRTTREKLLSYLSAEAEKHHSEEFTIPFSRQELADYLFVERSGLSVELSKMKKEELLDTEKSRFILYKKNS